MHGLRWVGTAKIFTQIVTWGLTALTIRFLQPGDYGLIATAGLFTSFANLLLDGGLGILLISERNLSAQVHGAAVCATLTVSATLGLLIIAVAPLGSAFFRAPGLNAILDVSAFYLPLAALAVVPYSLLSKAMRFRQIAVAQTLGSIVQGASTLGLAYAGKGYWALIIGNFLGTTIRVCALWAGLRTKPVPNFQFGLLRPLIRNSSHMIGQRLVYFVTGDFDTFLLSRFGGAVIVGPYSLAKSLSHTALDQLSGIVNQVSVPAFAAKVDPNVQRSGLLSLVSITSTLVFPLFWLMGVLSKVGLPLVFGARWASIVVPFAAFCLILPLRSLYTLLDSSVVGMGKTSVTFRNILTWATIMMPLIFLGARVNSNAVALAWILGFPCVFAATTHRIAKAFAVEMKVLLRPMVTPAICSAVSCGAVELARVNTTSLNAPISMFVVQIAVGGMCYVALIRYFGRDSYDKITGMILRLIRR